MYFLTRCSIRYEDTRFFVGCEDQSKHTVNFMFIVFSRFPIGYLWMLIYSIAHSNFRVKLYFVNQNLWMEQLKIQEVLPCTMVNKYLIAILYNLCVSLYFRLPTDCVA